MCIHQKDILQKAAEIAYYIVRAGTSNTDNGSWVIYFDELEDHFGVQLAKGGQLCTAIVEQLKWRYGERIAEIECREDCIDIMYYLDYCPNAE